MPGLPRYKLSGKRSICYLYWEISNEYYFYYTYSNIKLPKNETKHFPLDQSKKFVFMVCFLFFFFFYFYFIF